MRFHATPLPGAHTIELEKRGDDRGFFARFFCQREFEAAGLPFSVVQVNNSLTGKAGALTCRPCAPRFMFATTSTST